MTATILDIGGSGVKAVQLNSKNVSYSQMIPHLKHFSNPDWDNFVYWANKKGLFDCDNIAISCAGFVEADKKVSLFRVGGWRNKFLVDEFKEIVPNAKVFLLNDAEAHLMAHHELFELPQMSISLGTSLGFAISDKKGRIVRTLSEINFDLGALRLSTKASNNQLWWALGSNGLAELQKNMGKTEGARHYGYRLGAFLVDICSVFQPKTVVLSGGITGAWWDVFQHNMISEFKSLVPEWLGKITINKSPFGINAALVGMKNYMNIMGFKS